MFPRREDPPTERDANEVSRRRRVVRFLFAPELSRSLEGLREAGSSFGDLLRMFGETIRRREKGKERFKFPLEPMGFWLLVIGALCVVYGGGKLLVEVLAFIIPEAKAQVVDGSMFGGSDPKTRELLDFLYQMGRGDVSGISEMMRYFNYAIFGVVGVLLIYQVMFGVVETGRTGVNRISGWQVLRAVLAVVLIFPLPASGLGPGQHMFMSLLDVSGSMAAGLWSRFSEVVVAGGAPAQVAVPESHKAVAKKLIFAHTCMYVHNQVAANAGDSAYIVAERFDDEDVIRYTYKDPNWRQRHRSCGKIEISTVPEVENEGARIMARAHSDAVRSAAFVGAVDEAARELGDLVLSTSDTFGGDLPHVDAWLAATGVREAYSGVVLDTVGAATVAARESLDDAVRREIEREGWMAAASFFLVVARHHGSFLDAVGAVPEVRLMVNPSAEMGLGVVPPWDRYGHQVGSWLNESVDSSFRVSAHDAGSLSWLLEWFPVDSVIDLGDGNPLEELITFGRQLLLAGMAIIGLDVASGLVGLLPGGIGRVAGSVVGAAPEGTGGFFKMIGVLLMAAGVALGYLLPLIPFLRFYFGVVTWVIAVVEAIAAIPLFLAIHVNAEGSGVVNRASQQGYLLVLHAVIRPALMVLGLVFGYFIFVGGIRLFNWLYAGQLEAMENATRLGVVSFLIAWGVYTAVAYAVVNAAFKTIDVVPNEVMRWLGGYGRGGADESASGLVPVRSMFSRMGGLSAFPRGRGGGGRR